MKLDTRFQVVSKYLSKHTPTILTGLGIIGVATTAVMAAKRTPRAIEELQVREEYKQEHYDESLTFVEKALVVTPVYLPVILMGAATMSCIYGANYYNKKRQAALVGAYTYLNSCYSDYRSKVNELYGVDADVKVKASINKDIYDEIELGEVDNEDGYELYFEEYTGRYFKMDPNKLPNILYDINKFYNFGGELSLNDVCEYLGMERTPYGDTLGWAAVKDWECTGKSWIDIYTEPMPFPDNLCCKVIKFNVEPSDDYIQWTW